MKICNNGKIQQTCCTKSMEDEMALKVKQIFHSTVSNHFKDVINDIERFLNKIEGNRLSTHSYFKI